MKSRRSARSIAAISAKSYGMGQDSMLSIMNNMKTGKAKEGGLELEN
jgi:hypothetical protein